MTPAPLVIDPALDLVLQRVVPVPPRLVWKAWTEPEHLMKWFCPAPWRVIECDLQLWPGGRSFTLMAGPDGERIPSEGCYLEVVPERRLVFTDALTAGFRPAAEPFFTGIISLEPEGTGTRYTAVARHGKPEGKLQHEKMGFHEGWGAALDQLVALALTWG